MKLFTFTIIAFTLNCARILPEDKDEPTTTKCSITSEFKDEKYVVSLDCNEKGAVT